MKNHFYILLFVLLTGAELSAQSSVGFHFGIGLSHQLGPIKAAAVLDYFSMSPGFDYQYRLNERWSLLGRVGVMNLSEKYDRKGLRWGSEHNGSGDYMPDPSLPHEIKNRFFAFYAGVHVGARYYLLSQRRVRFFAQSDLQLNLLFGNRATRISLFDDGSIASQKTESLHQQQKVALLGGDMGFGAEIPLSDQFSIYLLPQGQMFFGSLNSGKDSATIIPGVQLGVFYSF